MQNPNISVVMPVYNGEKFLREAIESVLNQTYGDFEFIIVNDGSTDSSEVIISEYKDDRIKYICQGNTGIGGALRNGCSIAKGNYIARMDADDICIETRFEQQKLFLDNNPATVLVSNAVLYIDECGKTIGRSFPYTSNLAIKKKLKFGSPICHPSVMMRKNAYDEVGGYRNLELLEDFYLWIELSRIGELQNLSGPLLKYRVLNNSISRSITKNQYDFIRGSLLNMDKNNGLSESDVLEINKMYVHAKRERKSNYCDSAKVNKSLNNNKIEFAMSFILCKIVGHVKYVEYIICSMKNMSVFIKYHS